MAVKVWTGSIDTDWDNTGNWSGGVIPVNGDDVYIKQASNSILVNLDQNALSLSSLHITQAFNLQVGSTSESLKLDVDDVFVGSTADGSQGGAGMIALEFVTSNTNLDIMNGSNLGRDSVNNIIAGQNVLITGLGSGTIDLIVRRGSIGLLIDAGITGTLNSLTSYGGKTVLGDGLTVTTIDHLGGKTDGYFNVVTANLKGGTFTLLQDANITTLNLEDECEFISKGNGTITAINANGGIARLLSKGLTVTTITGSDGGSIDVDIDLVTITNDIAISSNSVILNMEF
jgi:hypothetical protein